MRWEYFGLQCDPFGATPNPRLLYPSRTHREALASLRYGFVGNRGFTAMIAPPGMGKTTLLCRFLDELGDSARSVFLFNIDSSCEPRELLGYILLDLGIAPGRSDYEMHRQLSDALVRERRQGRTVVVVIDEAQNLSDAMLERVRLLTNFETSAGKLMQLVLSGQPQLADRLMQPSLVQLRQRISTVCRLEPLSTEETLAYIDYRLQHAGLEGEAPFTVEALGQIAEASRGTPRTINNLCFNALSLCRALGIHKADGNIVSEIVADLQLTPPPDAANRDGAGVEPASMVESPKRKCSAQPFDSQNAPVSPLLILLALGACGLAKLLTPSPQTRMNAAPL
jgi:type II secretory pathway predicted ATPase ExeA